MKNHTDDRDALLLKALTLLHARNISNIWSYHLRPYSALREECVELMSDSEFLVDLDAFVKNRGYIGRSVDMFLNYMNVSERQSLDWNQPVIAMGQNIIRWIPTFLVIDGPIGRFLRWKESPLNSRLGDKYPLLTAARDLLENKDFKSLRHGLAHWNFDWDVSKDIHVIAYDTGKDSISTKLLLSEVDAFHICSFAVTEIFDEVFFQKMKK